MGISSLRKIQIGEEVITTKGTAVPATAALLGKLTMKDSPTIHRPDEERGNLADFKRSVKVGNMAELGFEGDATFEQILYWLHMGVLGNVTATGAGTAKEWVFTPAMAAAGVFDSFTIEHGDDIQAWEVEFCMAKQIEIALAMNAAATVKADIFGRKKTVCTFTTSLTPPTVETILGQAFRLYIDTETGKIGATVKANSLISATYTIKTGLVPIRYGDGSQDFTTYFEQVKGVDLKMVFAFNAGAETERLLFDGSTLRLVRIEGIGTSAQADEDSTSAVGTGGWTADATALLVTNITNLTADRVIEVDTEKILVTALTDATNIVGVRGYEGTTAATHAAAAALMIVHDKRLRLDFCGIYTDFSTLEERDGEDVVSVTLSTQRGTTYTKLFEVAVINKVPTLP